MSKISLTKTAQNEEQIQSVNGNAELKIGQVMQDGTVYAGISETTGTKMFTMPKDSGIMTWNNAIKFTQQLSGQYGYNGSKQKTAEELDYPEDDDGGWRLPTPYELNQLFDNKEGIGGFKSIDPWCSDSRYLSSASAYSEYLSNSMARMQCFTTGNFQDDFKDRYERSVRCVRTEARPKV